MEYVSELYMYLGIGLTCTGRGDRNCIPGSVDAGAGKDLDWVNLTLL